MKPFVHRIGCLGLATFLLVPTVALAGSNDVRSALTRVAGGPDGDAKGEIRVRSEDNGRQEFEVKAENVDPSLDHSLFMDDGMGTLQFVGVMEPEDADEVRFRARTKDGDPLPFSVASVADLEGRAVEVRQDAGAGDEAILEGTVPGLTVGRKGRARSVLSPAAMAPSKAKARVKMRSKPSKGDERLEVDAKRLDFAGGQDYHLFVEDPTTPGILVDEGAFVRKNSSQKIRFRRRTKDGDPLPAGAASVADLVGMAVEIVDVNTGDVYFDGVLPPLR